MAIVTSRYARAFADVVFERKMDAQQSLAEVKSLVAVVEGSPDLRKVFENPAIGSDQKRKLLDAIVSRAGYSQPVRNFMAVLIDHHRVHQLGEIYRLLEHEVNERLGLAEAEVLSARDLSDREKQELELKVSTLTGKRVRATYKIDRGLLGGAVVRLGSTIYDGSVKGQLQKIKEALSS